MSHFHSRPDPGVLYVGSEEANWGIILPVKDSHTRIKPLAFTSGHGRYITVTPERTPVSAGGCVGARAHMGVCLGWPQTAQTQTAKTMQSP
jgi:hypothetical protein